MGRWDRAKKDVDPPRSAVSVELPPFIVAEQSVGDRLFVQGQGVGSVTARKMLPAPHGPIEYIEVTLPDGHVFVPTQVPSTRVRSLVTASRARSILDHLRTAPPVVDGRPWEVRCAEWRAALMSANPERMADALLGLLASPGARSFGERKLAEELESQLYGELAAVMGLSVAEVRGQGISVAASA